MRTKNPELHLNSSTSPSSSNNEASASSSSNPPSPPPTKKPQTEKTQKYRPKVLDNAPNPKPNPRPKAKGIVIREPSASPHQTRSKTGLSLVQSKGKEKAKEKVKEKQREADLRAQQEELRTEILLQRLKRKSQLGSGSSGSQTLQSLLEATRSLVPPQGFNSTPLSIPESDLKDFQEHYGERECCPTVFVNLVELREQCNLDLSPWLKPFELLLALQTVYCPSVVKHFLLLYEDSQ